MFDISGESKFRDYHRKFWKIKNQVKNRSFSENMDILTNFEKRVRIRKKALQNKYMRNLKTSIQERKNKFRNLETNIRKFREGLINNRY